MTQSVKGSIAEAWAQLGGGLTLSFVSYLWILPPLFGISIPFDINIQITLYFAAMSWLKSFGIRRLFNHAIVRREVRDVRPQVGSIQSLPRQSGMSPMSKREYEDLTQQGKPHQSKGPVRSSGQEHESTNLEDNKELRQ